MNSTYIIYNTSTGQIIGIYSGNEIDNQINETTSYIQGYADSKQYVDIETRTIIDMPDHDTLTHKFDYTNKQIVPIKTPEEQLSFDTSKVKAKRKRLLEESDWTQLPDVPLETKQNWAVYRQSLRDITLQSRFPYDIQWPDIPQ